MSGAGSRYDANSQGPGRRLAKRVLHIGKYFPPHRGGMESYLRDLLTAQLKEGYRVAALVHSSDRRFFDKTDSCQTPEGHDHLVIRSARWFNVGFVPISPLFLLSAWRAIKQFKPDCIHVHHPNSSAALLLLLPAARRLSWFAQWHADIVTRLSSWPVKVAYFFYRPLEYLQLERAQRIYVSSPPYLKASHALKPFVKKCDVLPLGIDSARLPKAKLKEHVRPGSPRIILTVGRLTFYKGVDLLIEAVECLPNVTLWVVGDGEERASLERKAAQSEKANQIKFFGAVNDEALWALYQQCDTFCMPSKDRAEAYGIAQLEAAHFGKPVVTTRVAGSGLSWVTEHYRLGITSELAVDNLTECLALALEMGDVTHKNLELEIPSYQ